MIVGNMLLISEGSNYWPYGILFNQGGKGGQGEKEEGRGVYKRGAFPALYFAAKWSLTSSIPYLS